MSGQPPWSPLGQGPVGAYRPLAPVSAIFGRIIGFLGIAAALTCCVIWVVVGAVNVWAIEDFATLFQQ